MLYWGSMPDPPDLPPDVDVRLRHLYDQVGAHMADQAEPLAKFYRELRDAGMDETPAMALVLVTHLRMIGGLEYLMGEPPD